MKHDHEAGRFLHALAPWTSVVSRRAAMPCLMAAVAAIAGGAPEAKAQPAFILQEDGGVLAGDLETGGWTDVPAMRIDDRFSAGMDFTASGELWQINWTGVVRRWDAAEQRWRTMFNVRTVNRIQNSGFVKDLTWSPTRQAMLALWYESSPAESLWIWEIDLTTGLIVAAERAAGPASRILDGRIALALAAERDGTLWVGAVNPGGLYHLIWNGEGYQAELAQVYGNGAGGISGMGIDWRRDDAKYVLMSMESGRELLPNLQRGRNLGTPAGGADLAIAPCIADVETDGFVDFFDYARYVELFEAGDARADLTRDGFVDFHDYDRMVGAFEAGC